MLFLVFLLVVGGFALHVMSPAERARLLRTILGTARQVHAAATRERPDLMPFRTALRARTKLPLVTLVLVALNAGVFFLMLVAPGSFSDPATLVSWGGNFGPRTTNGEWRRLVTATFVNPGFLMMVVNVAGLLQVGLILERLVGPFTFAMVYLAAGAFAGLVSLSINPMAVGVGASPAIFGIYGLLLASSFWAWLQHRDRRPPQEDVLGLSEARPPAIEIEEPPAPPSAYLTIPLGELKLLAPAAGVFLLYNAATGLQLTEAIGFAVGLIIGLAVTIGIAERKPQLSRAAVAAAAAIVLVAAATVPLRGVADVRPEIARVVQIEDQTARTYQEAVDQFKRGRMSAKALAQVIDRKIIPALQDARERLKAIDGVPQEHQPLVAGADEYLRLRDESWRLRADALQKANMGALRRADRAEHASLEAFEKIKPAAPAAPPVSANASKSAAPSGR